MARVRWIDWYKGLAIALVLVHHVTQYFPQLTLLTGYVTDFHVSMFFFVAGYMAFVKTDKVTDWNSFKSNAIGKFHRLLVPYLCWAIVGASIKFAVLLLERRLDMVVLKTEVLEILGLGNGPIWFLKAMFFVSIFFPLWTRLVRPHKGLAVGSLVAMLVLWRGLLIGAHGLPVLVCRRFVACFAEQAIGFLVAGFVVRHSRDRRVFAASTLLFVASSGLGLSMDLSLTFKTGFAKNWLLVLICCNAIDLFLMLLLERLDSALSGRSGLDWLAFMGRESLGILAIHPVILNFFTHPLAHHAKDLSLAVQIFFGIFGTFLLALASGLVCRFFPRPFRWMIGQPAFHSPSLSPAEKA